MSRKTETRMSRDGSNLPNPGRHVNCYYQSGIEMDAKLGDHCMAPHEARKPKQETKQTSNSLQIQPAEFGDMLKIADMISSTADWYREIVEEKDMAEHDVGLDWAKRNYELREFYVGRSDGQAVGTISLQFFGKWAYLGYVYLDVNHVGKGFGKQLLDFAKETAKKRGMEGMVLIAHPKAQWATKAYRKYGFDVVSKDRERVLTWNGGVLKPHYEEGFELYRYAFKPALYSVQRGAVG